MSTLAAFLAALVAARYAAGAFRLESTRETRWDTQQRRAQAQAVAGWAGSETHNNDYSAFPAMARMMPKTSTDFGVLLRNASELPVTQLSYLLEVERVPMRIMPVGVLPPGSQPLFVKHPIEDMQFPELDEDWDVSTDAELEPEVPIGVNRTVALHFRDSAGRWWFRDTDGSLTESSAQPPWIAAQAGAHQ